MTAHEAHVDVAGALNRGSSSCSASCCSGVPARHFPRAIQLSRFMGCEIWGWNMGSNNRELISLCERPASVSRLFVLPGKSHNSRATRQLGLCFYLPRHWGCWFWLTPCFILSSTGIRKVHALLHNICKIRARLLVWANQWAKKRLYS